MADVVELAKHIGRHIALEWRPEKLEIADYKQQTLRFFVRTGADADAIAQAFGSVTYIDVPEAEGEKGFLTGEMTEEAYEKKAEALGDVRQMIRYS